MNIIANKSINYPFAGIVWILVSFIFWFLFLYVGFEGRFFLILSFIGGAVIAFGHRTRVPILSRGLLLFNGEEVTSNGNSVWLEPGMYFTFFIFSVSEEEAQHTEKRDVVVTPFVCQDKNGKNLYVEANGDYEIVDNDNFKVHVEENMLSNLQSLIKRSIIRVFARLDFFEDIQGKDVCAVIQEDPVYKRECKKYGIHFHNLIADAISKDLEQENSNYYYNKLYQEEVNKYPPNHQFTHDEIKDINETVQVRIGKAKKIVTNSPLLGRFDVKE